MACYEDSFTFLKLQYLVITYNKDSSTTFAVFGFYSNESLNTIGRGGGG
jgi:hypothetical protein